MDQVAAGAGEDEAEALRFALELGGLPLLQTLFQPVLRKAEAFWSPDPPPAVVLLGSLGQAFAAGFQTLGAGSRQVVVTWVERAMRFGSDHLQTIVATGFLEGVIHEAEATGTWPLVAAALGQESFAYAEAYRNAPFHKLDPKAVIARDDPAPGMGR